MVGGGQKNVRPGPDGHLLVRGRTDKRIDRHAGMGPNPLQVNAKCDVVMKLSVFGTQTHKSKSIHSRIAAVKTKALYKLVNKLLYARISVFKVI